MAEREQPVIKLRAWREGDLHLMERLLGDPAMMEHLGGPESPEKLRRRHQDFVRSGREPSADHVFVIVVGPDEIDAGSIGYWEREWQGEPAWEAGWSVLPEFQGQGIATAATQMIVQMARADEKR